MKEGSPSRPGFGSARRAASAPSALYRRLSTSSGGTPSQAAPPTRGGEGVATNAVSTSQPVPAPHEGRLRMRLAIGGRTVCFQGPARYENGWSIPCHVFDVHNVVGQRVFLVNDDNRTLTTESFNVSAVITPDSAIAPRWLRLTETAEDGWVSITLGDTVLPHTEVPFEDKPREDGSDVTTPPTPLGRTVD